jgi:hypothetical protein
MAKYPHTNPNHEDLKDRKEVKINSSRSWRSLRFALLRYGYLFTARTCDPAHPVPGIGAERWVEETVSHEPYNVGHLYEAAVAHFQATGKRTLLDVAVKNADLVASVFGPDKRRAFPGHEEIELALVKLYRVTGNENYLRLAKYFLENS